MEGPQPQRGRTTTQEEGGEIKYRGVQKRTSGKYGAEIRNPAKHGDRDWLGTFNSAIEAARAYDKAAYRMRGNLAILNFPEEYNLPSSSSHFASASSSSTSALTSISRPGIADQNEDHKEERIELECLDDKVLDELLAASLVWRGQD